MIHIIDYFKMASDKGIHGDMRGDIYIIDFICLGPRHGETRAAVPPLSVTAFARDATAAGGVLRRATVCLHKSHKGEGKIWD